LEPEFPTSDGQNPNGDGAGAGGAAGRLVAGFEVALFLREARFLVDFFAARDLEAFFLVDFLAPFLATRFLGDFLAVLFAAFLFFAINWLLP
jgi:hypothetical protein